MVPAARTRLRPECRRCKPGYTATEQPVAEKRKMPWMNQTCGSMVVSSNIVTRTRRWSMSIKYLTQSRHCGLHPPTLQRSFSHGHSITCLPRAQGEFDNMRRSGEGCSPASGGERKCHRQPLRKAVVLQGGVRGQTKPALGTGYLMPDWQAALVGQAAGSRVVRLRCVWVMSCAFRSYGFAGVTSRSGVGIFSLGR